MNSEPKLWVATKAFIEHNRRILVIRESRSYSDGENATLYDVPGGRLEPGEHILDALRREVREEAGIEIDVQEPVFVNEWRPVVRGEQWHVVGIFFCCTARSSAVKLGPDHDDYKWIDPKTYASQQIIPNLHSAFEAYLQRTK